MRWPRKSRPDPDPSEGREQVDRALWLELFQQLSSRRDFAETTLWQAPALALAAQAFLLTIALDPSASLTGRLLSTGLAFIVAWAAIQLMARRHRQIKADNADITSLYKDDLARAGRDNPYEPLETRDPMPALWGGSAAIWWLTTLWAFLFGDLFIFIIAIASPNWLGSS
jgi:hypothetical protein